MLSKLKHWWFINRYNDRLKNHYHPIKDNIKALSWFTLQMMYGGTVIYFVVKFLDTFFN